MVAAAKHVRRQCDRPPELPATPHEKFDLYSNAVMVAVGHLAETVLTGEEESERMKAALALIALEKARLRHQGDIVGAREKPGYVCELEPLPDYSAPSSQRDRESGVEDEATKEEMAVGRCETATGATRSARRDETSAPLRNGVVMQLNETREPDITEEMIERRRRELAEEPAHLRCPEWSPGSWWNTCTDDECAEMMESHGYARDTAWTQFSPMPPPQRAGGHRSGGSAP